MADLVDRVFVRDERGGDVEFKPGDEVPEWAARQMGAHCFEDGDHPFGDASEREDGAEPPRSGKGSSQKAWAAFAAEHSIEIDPDASREEIIAALTAAGVVTE